MKQEQCRVALGILCVVAMILVIIKTVSMDPELVEVNYIGDMERENEEQIVEEDEKEEAKEDANEDANEEIRVLIKSTGFESINHEQIEVSADAGLIITYGDIVEEVSAQECYILDVSSAAFEAGSVQITTIEEDDKITIHSIERSYGIPEYDGMLEVYTNGNQVVIVNELEIETYLQGVLPSEMPSYFEMEALKAQAVCARSYAYTHLSAYDYPEYQAHIDDSTSYQVYNNLEESEICNQAILETQGEKLSYNGEIITAYFFSTSCGHTTDIEAWGGEMTDATSYLSGVEVSGSGQDYEVNLPWYRWSITVSEEDMRELINENLGLNITELQSVAVTETGTGGVALTLEIKSDIGDIVIETEYAIRSALGSSRYEVEKQDGTQVQGSALLPSAFIEIEKTGNDYVIQGGGFGHGIGMSQNGANEMAKEGKSYEEILALFYSGTELVL